MPNFTPKQLGMVGRIGPAFSLDEIPMSHEILDRAGVPRQLKGETLTLPERVSYLAGMLTTARMAAAHRRIIVVNKDEPGVVITQGYPESEAQS